MRWTPPSGSKAGITGYVVTPYAGWSSVPLASRVFNRSKTTRVITGLKAGKTYRFKVTARYVDGYGPASAATNAVRIGR